MAHPPPPPPAAPDAAAPAQAPGDALLEQALAVLGPLARLLVANGVGYTQLAAQLKPVFMAAAHAELQTSGKKTTDAAISLLSGVHRKDVRAWSDARGAEAGAGAEGGPDSALPAGDGAPGGPPRAGARALSIAEQVFTLWQTHAGYRDAEGRAAPLPIAGPAPSFDTLVQTVTRDFSRRTVLDELVRLGLVDERDGQAVPLADAVVPRTGFAELARYFGDHLHDHMAAGAANLRAARAGEAPPFLEHSLYARGLSPASIEQLARLARDAWKPAFSQMVEAANQRYAIDRDRGEAGRLRFGVYFYSEPGDDSR